MARRRKVRKIRRTAKRTIRKVARKAPKRRVSRVAKRALKNNNVSRREVRKLKKAGASRPQIRRITRQAKKVNRSTRKISRIVSKPQKTSGSRPLKRVVNTSPQKGGKLPSIENSGKKGKGGKKTPSTQKVPRPNEQHVRPAAIKGWDPDQVRKHVSDQWSDKETKAKRLTISKDKNRPDRIKKYTNKESGVFDQDRYAADVRSKLANRYKSKGGERKNVGKILSADGPRMPNLDKIKPKYSGAMDKFRSSLDKEFGKKTYGQRLKQTQKKLVGDKTQFKESKLRKTGMSHLKNMEANHVKKLNSIRKTSGDTSEDRPKMEISSASKSPIYPNMKYDRKGGRQGLMGRTQRRQRRQRIRNRNR